MYWSMNNDVTSLERRKETSIFQDTHMYMIVCTRVVLECDGCHGDMCGMYMYMSPCKILELV